MIELPSQTLILIGGAVVAFILYLIKTWFQHFFTEKLDDLKQQKDEDIAERKADMKLQLEGQSVIADCLHETMYVVINGEHNGGLQRCDEELEAYRKKVNAALINKAANWNVQDGK